MKRRVFALVSLLILMLTMTAHAIEPYGAVQMPILSFIGLCDRRCRSCARHSEWA